MLGSRGESQPWVSPEANSISSRKPTIDAVPAADSGWAVRCGSRMIGMGWSPFAWCCFMGILGYHAVDHIPVDRKQRGASRVGRRRAGIGEGHQVGALGETSHGGNGQRGDAEG